MTYEYPEGHFRSGICNVKLEKDPDDGMLYVIKKPRIKDSKVGDPVRRFLREVYVHTQLEKKYSFVPRIIKIRLDDENSFMKMQPIPGLNLAEFIVNNKFDNSHLGIYAKVAKYLDTVHGHELENPEFEEDLAHRDVKPQNIMVNDGDPKLLDFGDAHLRGVVMDDSIIGTPHFMAPEQVDGYRHTSPETDVYGFGATLYFGITGRHLFPEESIARLFDNISFEKPDDVRVHNPTIGDELGNLVMECLSKRKDARPKMSEVHERLALTYLQHQNAVAREVAQV